MSISSAIRASLASLGDFIGQAARAARASHRAPARPLKATKGAAGRPQGAKRINRRAAFGPKVALGPSKLMVPELRKRKSEQDPVVLAQQQDAAHRDWMKTRVE